MGNMTRRGLLVGAGAGIGALGTRYFYTTPIANGLPFPVLPKGGSGDATLLNDAGELSPTRLAKHIVLNSKPGETLLAALRTELKEAQSLSRPVVAHAARHSMGGQSLISDGLAITLDQDWIEPDTAAKTYRVAEATLLDANDQTIQSYEAKISQDWKVLKIAIRHRSNLVRTFIAIHFRHLNIHQYKLEIFGVDHFNCFLTMISNCYIKPVFM